jgi:ferric-dicitrate binding protein FerR (iron transport regulator)
MITAADGDIDSLGTQFLVLDVDGRIRLDYQFIEKPPTT